MVSEPHDRPARRDVLSAIGAAGAGIATMAKGAAPAAAQTPAPGSRATAPLAIVDFHNHTIAPGLKTNGVADTRLMEDTAALAASVDEARIQARVINTPTAFLEDADGNVPPDTHKRINDGLAELAAKHKGRLHALATVDAFGGDAAARELTRAVKENGLRGVFVESAKRDLLLDAPQARPVLKTAAQLGIPVFVHPQTDKPLHERFKRHGRLGVRFARGTINSATLLAMLDGGVFEDAAGLKIVVTTLAMGGLMLAGGFGEGNRIRADTPAAQRRHVYVDTMGLNPVQVRCAVDLLGADHVLMGTDWPIVVEKQVPERLQKALDASGLDAAAQQLVAGGNAMKLLGLA